MLFSKKNVVFYFILLAVSIALAAALFFVLIISSKYYGSIAYIIYIFHGIGTFIGIFYTAKYSKTKSNSNGIFYIFGLFLILMLFFCSIAVPITVYGYLSDYLNVLGLSEDMFRKVQYEFIFASISNATFIWIIGFGLKIRRKFQTASSG